MADLYAVKSVERSIRGVGAWYGQPMVAVRFYQDQPVDLTRAVVRNHFNSPVVYSHAQLVDAIAACLPPCTVAPHLLLTDDFALGQVDVTLERVLKEAFQTARVHVDVAGTRSRAFAVDWATLTLPSGVWDGGGEQLCRIAYHERFASEVCYHLAPRAALPLAQEMARMFPRAQLWVLPQKTDDPDANANASAWRACADAVWNVPQASDGRGWRIHPLT